ncbi:MAG: mechanosensitive ion channel [Caulobacteraceae bacterium]|nr:mechanosensitive ion channel [Caulobacteraceae bacterium]
MTYDAANLTLMAETWAPRIGVAILIVVVAWIVGRVLKSLIVKGIDRLPPVAKHNQGADPKSTVGVKIGAVVYWLVLLFGVVAALNELQLGGVAAPLNTMMTNFLSYIPNVVGAGLIFFVGFIVASLARKLVTAALEAADLDKYLARLGLGGAGAGGLASAIGTLVFVLIIVPVAIAALQALRIEAISAPAIVVLTTILNAIPNVIAAGIVLAIGLLIGRWIGGVVERLLPATGIDKLLGSVRELSSPAKVDPAASRAEALGAAPKVPSASKIIGGVVTFAVVAFSAIEAARLLQFAAIALILAQILALAGRVILGAAIIAVGVVIADMLATAIGRSAGEADKFAATLVKWATIALAAAMGLRSMGIADEIVILAFGLILGAAAVAAALAFGLGAQKAAGRVAEHWVDKAQRIAPPKQ